MADLKLDVLHTHKVKAMGALLRLLQFTHKHAAPDGTYQTGCVIANVDDDKKALLNALRSDWDAMEEEIIRLRAENAALKGES